MGTARDRDRKGAALGPHCWRGNGDTRLEVKPEPRRHKNHTRPWPQDTGLLSSAGGRDGSETEEPLPPGGTQSGRTKPDVTDQMLTPSWTKPASLCQQKPSAAPRTLRQGLLLQQTALGLPFSSPFLLQGQDAGTGPELHPGQWDNHKRRDPSRVTEPLRASAFEGKRVGQRAR